MNWFIVEQLPLIAPERYADPLGTTPVGDFVREQVLRLSYTAHDLAGFARDLGYDGEPFVWDPADSRHPIARPDAPSFNLSGLARAAPPDVLDTFPLLRHAANLHFSRTPPRDPVLGHDGEPFVWDPEDRRHRIARLDALYFNLYGLDRDEAAYVLDTFPIVRDADERAFGRYRTRDLVLGYMAALAAGDTESVLAL